MIRNDIQDLSGNLMVDLIPADGDIDYSPITSIPGLLAFYDDGRRSNFEFNTGDQVSKWIDLSGNALDATQVTSANQPSYTGNRLVFDGTQTYLNCPLKYAWDTQEFSIYTVQNGNGATNAFRGAFTNRPGFGNWLTIGHSMTADSFLMEAVVGAVPTTQSPIPAFQDRTSGDFIFTMLKENDPKSTLRINNASENVSVLAYNFGGITQSCFIGFWAGVPQVWDGSERTLIFLDHKVTAGENAQIINWISENKEITV